MRERLALRLVALLLAYPGLAPRAQSIGSTPRAADMDKVHIDGFQRRMVADPALIEKIRALQNDPAIQDVLGDPEIAAALECGDTTASMANPKVGALIEHPTVCEITNKLDE